MKKLLVVKTGTTYDVISEKYGDFEEMIIRSTGLEQSLFEVFDAKDESLAFPTPDKYAGVIITGSHDMLTFQDDWMIDLKEWILTITETQTPTLGICFGHHAMAEAFGGVVDYRDWSPEVGCVKVDFNLEASEDKLFADLYNKAYVYQYHAQSVKELPKNVVLLGGNSIEPYQAVRYNNHMWSCQFHPEFNEEILRDYIEQNALHLSSEGLDPYELLIRLKPSDDGRKLFRNFIKFCNI